MKKNIPIVILIIASFIGYKFFFGGSDKAEIKKIIVEIEENLEYDKVLPPLSVLGRLKKIRSHLAPGFRAKAIDDGREWEAKNLDKIKENALLATRYFTTIDITKLPTFVKVSGKSATANFTMTVKGKDKSSTMFNELFEIEMGFIKMDGKWLCSSISAERLTPEE